MGDLKSRVRFTRNRRALVVDFPQESPWEITAIRAELTWRQEWDPEQGMMFVERSILLPVWPGHGKAIVPLPDDLDASEITHTKILIAAVEDYMRWQDDGGSAS